MMTIIWISMLIISVFSSFLQHSTGILTASALEGCKNAINLCISLAGPLCLWAGLAKVMEKAGLTQKLGTLLRPIFRKLFPNTYNAPLISGHLTGNITANLLGLGNAATPMGIAAVKEMHKLQSSPCPNDEICRLIIMNTASIQLLPTTVAAVRAAAGSATPFDILPGVWVTSLCSVAAGLLAAKVLRRFYA